jgi:predicted flap endonuclease-1-like 5' DNA nuclease
MNRTAIPEQKTRSIFVIAAITLALASIVVWWINTVAAMLFLFAAMFVAVYTFCSVPLNQPPARVRQRRLDGMSIERIDLLEKRMRESLEEIVMMEEEEESEASYAIPVDEVEEVSTGLEHDIPVEIIDGIGKAYSTRLQEIGILNLEDLALSSPERIQEACDVTPQEAAGWVADAIAIFMGAGMTSVLELAMSDADEIIKRIQLALENEKIRAPEGHDFTIWKARHWITAANEHIILSPEDIRRWAEDNR